MGYLILQLVFIHNSNLVVSYCSKEVKNLIRMAPKWLFCVKNHKNYGAAGALLPDPHSIRRL